MNEAMTGDERRPASPQSVTRVIRILEALCASDGAVGLAELARVLGTPKSSLAALLRGLADEAFVAAADGGYQLGPGAFGLGSALVEARRRSSSSDLVREAMRRLADRSGETVLFAVREPDGDVLTYVEVIESRSALRFARGVGDRRPLYCTAAGRALLAAGPEAETDAYLARLRAERLTAATETGRRALGQAIAAARATGFARTVDQASDGITGTAAAIRDCGGAAIGALVVAAPTSRLADRGETLARLVVEEAVAVSRGLGWRAPPI